MTHSSANNLHLECVSESILAYSASGTLAPGWSYEMVLINNKWVIYKRIKIFSQWTDPLLFFIIDTQSDAWRGRSLEIGRMRIIFTERKKKLWEIDIKVKLLYQLPVLFLLRYTNEISYSRKSIERYRSRMTKWMKNWGRNE